jgi:hypothetical protein
MAEEDKTSENDIPFAEFDLPKIVDEEEPGSSQKALLPFDPLNVSRDSPVSPSREDSITAVEYKEFGNLEAAALRDAICAWW